MIKMDQNINIALVGLGQIGIYLYNELRTKKKKLKEKVAKVLILLLFQPGTKIK